MTFALLTPNHANHFFSFYGNFWKLADKFATQTLAKCKDFSAKKATEVFFILNLGFSWALGIPWILDTSDLNRESKELRQ